MSLDFAIRYCSPSWLDKGTIRQYRWEYIVYVIVYVIYDITLGKAKKTTSYTILYKILYTILLQFNLWVVSFCLAGWRQIESKAWKAGYYHSLFEASTVGCWSFVFHPSNRFRYKNPQVHSLYRTRYWYHYRVALAWYRTRYRIQYTISSQMI